MNAKNITTLIGGILIAIGPGIIAMAQNTNQWWSGLVVSTIGGILNGLRGLIKTPEEK